MILTFQLVKVTDFLFKMSSLVSRSIKHVSLMFFFSERPLYTDTLIIWTLWLVPLVSVLYITQFVVAENKYALSTKSEVKVAGYRPSSFMCFHSSQSIKMQRMRTLFSHLDHTSLVSKGFNIWPKSELLIAGPMQAFGSQSECRIHFILPTCGFSHKL